MIERIAAGRTDLVAEYLAAGHRADSTDADGVSLLAWCAYYGDVTAVRHLVAQGARLGSLGDDLGLNAAAFHGHWRLCEFLLERGADPNRALPDTGETPLHAALSASGRASQDLVVRVLLAKGADPNRRTKPGVETGAFMRDCRTRGETPLHRAAAYAAEITVARLIEAGADRETRDANGDSPLSWASWHLRPAAILRRLCFGPFRVREDYAGLEANLQGQPAATAKEGTQP